MLAQENGQQMLEQRHAPEVQLSLSMKVLLLLSLQVIEQQVQPQLFLLPLFINEFQSVLQLLLFQHQFSFRVHLLFTLLVSFIKRFLETTLLQHLFFFILNLQISSIHLNEVAPFLLFCRLQFWLTQPIFHLLIFIITLITF